MKYKIGTVAKLLGVSPEALRLYERNGILISDRGDGENGYRYYSRLDITALSRARAYHQYGFSLKETEALINTDDVDFVCQAYELKAEDLEQEILRKQQILNYLKGILNLLEQLKSELWTIRPEIRPGIYRLEFMKGEELILAPDQLNLFPKWVGLAPFAFPSQRNCWTALEHGTDESFSALGILEEDARSLGMPDFLHQGVYLPPTPSLYTVVEISEENASCVGYLAHLTDFVRRCHIKVTGDPICRTFLSMNKKENYRRYRQIWVPIAPNEFS